MTLEILSPEKTLFRGEAGFVEVKKNRVTVCVG